MEMDRRIERNMDWKKQYSDSDMKRYNYTETGREREEESVCA